ncbi:anti-sigma factor [Desulfosarcina sp.]|uniref:anti-sigma factor family protein n=1 Tax=Desulfosarcina sp. TaxID=2027861 RepID=UPI003565F185
MKQNDPHPSHENCLTLFERLSEYIDRELDAPTCKEIEAHIKACKPCQVCLETLKQTVALCGNLERRQVPETFSLKLKNAIFDLVNKKVD